MNFAHDLAERTGHGSTGQPFGINWFHPHVHGIAKAQVSLGMTGMILIGDPLAHLCLSANTASETCNKVQSDQLLAKTRIRNILVKDAQLIHLGGVTGRWLNMADQDPGFCQGNEKSNDNIGGCLPLNPSGMAAPSGTLVDLPGSADVGPRWLFTLNGQRYPDIDFDTAHPYQVLRIQNASANITYKLSLRRSFDDGAVAAPYAFSPKVQVLSLDGARLRRDRLRRKSGQASARSPAHASQPGRSTDRRRRSMPLALQRRRLSTRHRKLSGRLCTGRCRHLAASGSRAHRRSVRRADAHRLCHPDTASRGCCSKP